MPRWIKRGTLHDERLSSERSKMFPLLLQSNHGRWRVHAQCDDITWTREAPTCKVTGPDGYKYEPCWHHTSEAEKRGIKNGDIVKIINERGIVLAGAYVTERLRPGAAYIDHGARIDFIKAGEIDRWGAINTISPGAITSKNAVGEVVTGYLVQVERLRMEEMDKWRREYPEAFEVFEGKNVGDTAELTGPNGDTITGTCGQEGDKLVLRPYSLEGMAGGRRHDPPAEAVDACKDKSEGDTAEFVNKRGDTITGTCEWHGEQLVVRPDNPPPGIEED